MDAPQTQFFGRVESLRGLAAGMVAFGHIWGLQLVPADTLGFPSLLRMFSKGDHAVLMFFVISGFVLFFSLQRLEQDASGALRFLVARVFRIYPAAIAVVLLFAVVQIAMAWLEGQSSNIGFRDVVLNALLFRTDINGVMWTLQVELLAAPIIAAAYFAYRRFGVAALWTLFWIFTALSFVGKFNRIIGTPMLGFHAFMLGMIVAASGRDWFAKLSRSGATAIFLGATIVFFGVSPVLGWTSHWGTIVAVFCSAVMVALAAFQGIGPGLNTSAARFFGRISYSFYLLHPLVLCVLHLPVAAQIAARLVESGIPPSMVIVIVFVLSVLAIVPLAYLFLIKVEYPGIALGRRFFSPRPLTATR
ncbi:MAG: hypothetical protein A4S14_13155 [Proteobacteria bacterium SG_bin9]|nr:MAG: hypothetical protein A4S14_13155 [Proteobacteria bacterium SG_bin9]